MKINAGDIVKADYEGRFESREVFDSSYHGDHSHPLEFEVGSGQVIRGFEDAVIGMEKGKEKEITIEAKDAYGEPNPEMTKDIPIEMIKGDKKPEVGMMLVMQSAQGHQIPAKIIKVDDKNVTIDLNHPLAGKKLIFKIKIIGINEGPSEDEHTHEH
ncbi:MAG: FKBP-type peptidyl-prolyl cis-trans isomerase [Nanoarchaeota archaeon]